MGDSTNWRILALEGVENYRDFGGYRAAAGGQMVRGQFWRSAHQGKATSGDLAKLETLNLQTVVDLRRPAERAAEPSVRHAPLVIECDLGDRTEAPHVAFLRETDLTAESAQAFFFDYYAKAPFEPRHQVLFRRYFAALADGHAPILIHCTAGKDRTGLLAALTHHVLGVHSDDAATDYMLTNHAAHLEARLPIVTQALANTLGKVPSEVAVRAFLGVDAKYLQAAMAAIVADSGSVDAYLAKLDVTGERVARLREQYLV